MTAVMRSLRWKLRNKNKHGTCALRPLESQFPVYHKTHTHTMIQLYPHQKTAVEWMTRTENRTRMVHDQPHGGILAHAMGLGKTISMLSLIQSQPKGRTLVVCPKSLLSQWQSESARVLTDCPVVVYHGTGRDTSTLPSNLLLLTTFDIVRIEAKDASVLHATQWDRVVLDEAHRICEQTSKTSKAIRSLRARNRWCVTGTPFKNGISDLMALSRFLMISPYCNVSWWRMYGQSSIKMQEWRDLFLHMRDKSELTSLPPIVYRNIKVELPPGERELYTSLGTKDWSPRADDDDQQELLRILRQRQATNHPVLITPPKMVSHVTTRTAGCCGCTTSPTTTCDKNHDLCDACCSEPVCPGCIMHAIQDDTDTWTHSAKTRALWEYLRDVARVKETNTKVVVFSQWTSCLDLLSSMLDCMGVGHAQYDGRINSTEDRDGVIHEFRHVDTCQVLLTSLGAGGEGVNLTFASHVVLMEPYWNLAAEQQAIDRLHRIGQTQTTHVARFTVTDTIEDWVYDIQTRKASELERLLFGSVNPVKERVKHIRPEFDTEDLSLVGLDCFIKRRKVE